MAIIKCKMCGGDIELTTDKTFGTCEFCGSTMTLPKVDDDQRAAAFNRGNHFRRIGEFDKALAVYERIVREDDTDAEAHWCCALCRFGIEYVEDPTTYEYLPTCHRASFDSFLEDVDYLAAVEHSDGITKRQYQKDGAKIAEVQRGILATSQNAEPYDVFICYKESDANGNRTRDSLMAQDIYYQLTEQGRRVFFARITLEDVGGTEYEPYIFAALNSAKVMIVVGTKPEYLNAVWVKNEWSRFLAMMKKDRHKLLLPCYRDMDPYDMPEALSVLQSYDMAKIGFIQDLTRGIAKVLDADKKPEPVKETVVVQQTGGTNIAPLLKRAFMFLEDGDWNSADEYCEKVLDIDPECAQAYLGKLMAELHVKSQEDLKNQAEPFDGKKYYQKAMRFGDEKLKTALAGDIEHINTRNENARLESIYVRAKNAMLAASKENAYTEAARLFDTISTYKDSKMLAKQCIESAEVSRKNDILSSAKVNMQANTIVSYNVALGFLESISGWKDANDQIEICKKRIAELTEQAERERLAQEERERKEMLEREEWARQQAEADRLAREERARQKAETERLAREKAEVDRIEAERLAKKKKKITVIVACLTCMILAIVLVITKVIIPNSKYNEAVALIDAGNLDDAYTIFCELGDFKDAVTQRNELDYIKANTYLEEGQISKAYDVYASIFEYKDSTANMQTLAENHPCLPFRTANPGDIVTYGRYEQNGITGDDLEPIEWIVLTADESTSRVLLVSKMVLDAQPYDARCGAPIFESSSLYAWLQEFFMHNAFSSLEQGYLYGAIMIPNTNEVEYYSLSKAEHTEYAKSVGEQYRNYLSGDSWWTWWASDDRRGEEGMTYDDFHIIDKDAKMGVRPMIWVNTEVQNQNSAG